MQFHLWLDTNPGRKQENYFMITCKCDMWLGLGPKERYILSRPGIEQVSREDTDKILR